MSGLDEIAEATAWQRANGNVSMPCGDCGLNAIAMWTAYVTIAKKTTARTVCSRCYMRRQVEG